MRSVIYFLVFFCFFRNSPALNFYSLHQILTSTLIISTSALNINSTQHSTLFNISSHRSSILALNTTQLQISSSQPQLSTSQSQLSTSRSFRYQRHSTSALSISISNIYRTQYQLFLMLNLSISQ